MGVLSRQLVVHRFCCDVLLLKKGVEYQFTLAGEFELVLPEMLLQDSHFFGVFGHYGVRASCREGH